MQKQPQFATRAGGYPTPKPSWVSRLRSCRGWHPLLPRPLFLRDAFRIRIECSQTAAIGTTGTVVVLDKGGVFILYLKVITDDGI
jgi:hypothetical protein